ncbi:retrovirus polyprotein [Apiospora arundinis]
MDLDATKHDKNDRKQNVTCYNCQKKGHYARECRGPKKVFQRVPEGRQINATRSEDTPVTAIKGSSASDTPDVPHGSLSWTACYDDGCTTHLADKEGTGWFPKAPRGKKNRDRALAATSRELTPAYALETDDSSSDEETIEQEQPIDDPQRLVGMPMNELVNEIAKPRDLIVDGWLAIPGIPCPDSRHLRQVLITAGFDQGITSNYAVGDDPRITPTSEAHFTLSWISCVHDACTEHLAEKLENEMNDDPGWTSSVPVGTRRPTVATTMPPGRTGLEGVP